MCKKDASNECVAYSSGTTCPASTKVCTKIPAGPNDCMAIADCKKGSKPCKKSSTECAAYTSGTTCPADHTECK